MKTREEIEAMSDEERNRETACLLKLKLHRECPDCVDGWEGTETDHYKCSSCGGTGKAAQPWYDSPDYLNSLDAMHNVWKSKIETNSDLEDLYSIALGIVCGELTDWPSRPDFSDHGIAIVSNATARQRNTAFLMTMP